MSTVIVIGGVISASNIVIGGGLPPCGGLGLLGSFANRWKNNLQASSIVPFDRFVTGRIPNVEEYPYPYMALIIPGGEGHGRSDRTTWARRTAAIHVWVDMARVEEGEAICEQIRQVYCSRSWRYDYGNVIDVLDHGPPNIIQINEPTFSYQEFTKTMTLCIQQKRVDSCTNICRSSCEASSSFAPASSSAG